MKTLVTAIAACLLAGMTLADSFCRISLWRGETHSVVLPDASHEVSGTAPGLTLQLGTLLPVRYLEDNTAYEYRAVADRAVYGSKASGLHFATVTAAADARPGTYSFGHLVVTVLDRVLPPPSEWKYYLDLWQHPWAVARINGLKPFSPEHYRAMEPLWRMLAAAGQKTLTVTIVDRPWDRHCYDAYGSMIGRRKVKGRDQGEEWQFDYSLFDEYVEFGRSCGIGPHISCYSVCPMSGHVDYPDADGKSSWIPLKPATPAFEEYWRDFLVDFERHLKEKGWLGDTYIAMDESELDELKAVVSFVRRHAPGLKVALAGNRVPSHYKGLDFDSYSQILNDAVDADWKPEVARRKREGKVTTCYVCCGPPRPNTFMSSAPGEAFVCGFFPAAYGLDGFLRWAYNSWGEDPLNDMTYNRWRSGDVALVYPDGSPSWRFLELKNGIQQAEKFRILKETGVRTNELEKVAAKFIAKELIEGTDCRALRQAVLNAVNK